mgnify:CR=1 FL=1
MNDPEKRLRKLVEKNPQIKDGLTERELKILEKVIPDVR